MRSEHAIICSMIVLAASACGCGQRQAAPAVGPSGPGADEPADKPAAYEKAADEAVEKGLKFLAGKQKQDGSFESPRVQDTAAVTSLAVMAFLAKGYMPESGPYADTIRKGIDYVLSCQRDGGLLCKGDKLPMYSHCISTLMLSEAYGTVSGGRKKRVNRAIAKAVKLILTAQQVNKDSARERGGWRYYPTSRDSDISVTGWAMMALRSAANAGIAVPREAMDDGVKYILRLRCPRGGYGYNGPADPGLARTGVALLCLQLCDSHGGKAAEGAGKWILSRMRGAKGGWFYYYGLYYCAQGTFQLGGEAWKTYAEHMYKIALERQLEDGSWPLVGVAKIVGPCYSTAMTVLAMSVTYQELPMYRR